MAILVKERDRAFRDMLRVRNEQKKAKRRMVREKAKKEKLALQDEETTHFDLLVAKREASKKLSEAEASLRAAKQVGNALTNGDGANPVGNALTVKVPQGTAHCDDLQRASQIIAADINKIVVETSNIREENRRLENTIQEWDRTDEIGMDTMPKEEYFALQDQIRKPRADNQRETASKGRILQEKMLRSAKLRVKIGKLEERRRRSSRKSS